jgi:hypothetical protein
MVNLLIESASQIAIPTNWKFIVEYEDDETKEIGGTLGEADTYEECQALIEHEGQYQCFCGRTVVDMEIWNPGRYVQNAPWKAKFSLGTTDESYVRHPVVIWDQSDGLLISEYSEQP